MLEIVKVEVYEIFIPFRFKYGHALKSHNGVSSLICKVFDKSGLVGFGESVPREYVTGENCSSVIKGIKDLSRDFINRELTLEIFKSMILEKSHMEHCFPSCSFCAFEGAVLDLFGRIMNKPIASLFKDEGKNPLVYSGSIGFGSKSSIKMKAIVYNLMDFKNHKIKVGRDTDKERILQIKKYFSSDCTFFADANCAWDREEAIKRIEELYSLGVSAIEEPLKPGISNKYYNEQLDRESILTDEHYQNYKWLRDRSPIPIIADESLISMRSLDRIIEHEAFDILNVRLSKCGGFIIGSEIVRIGKENNMQFGIGAMVAETPILANAGSHFGYINSDHNYIQGYSHKALHSKSFIRGGLDLTKGGIVNMDLTLPGNGLNVIEKRLNKLTKRVEIIDE